MTAYNTTTKQFIDGAILTKADLDQAVLDAEATARAQALAALPIASATQLGVVKQGVNVSIATDGTISAVGGGGGGVSLGSATPLADSPSPTPGSALNASHEDHRHPYDATREAIANKGQPNGYAGLDGSALVPSNQLRLVTALTPGIVPATGGGSATFFCADGTFKVPPSTGGGSNYPAPRVVTSSANIQLLATDGLVAFSRTISPAATLVTLPVMSPLPAVPPYWPITIKDMAGNAGTYPLTIQSASGTVDGQTSKTLNRDFDAHSFQWNGAEWSEV